MENNEKYITDRIQSHREEIDLDSLWEGVSPHIPKEKKRNKFGFWIFGGLVIGLLIISFLWLTNSEMIPEESKLTIIEKMNGSQDLLQQVNTEQISNDKTVVEMLVNAEILAQDSKGNLHQVEDEKLQNKPVLDDLKTSILNQSEISEHSLKTLIPSTRSNYIIQSKNKLPVKNSFLPNVITTQEIDNKNNLRNPVNNEMWSKKERAKLNVFAQLNRDLQLLKKEARPILSNLEMDMIEIQKPSINVNRWNVFLFGGGGILDRKLELKSQTLEGERDRRNNSFEIAGNWNIEGGIGYRISPKLRIMMGFNYTQIHEKEIFKSDYFIDVEVVAENEIRRQDGSIYNEITTSNIQGQRIITETRYNQIRLLQIPIRLSYDVLQLDKYVLSIGGLASYSIKQKYKGFTSFSASQETYDITLDKDNKFRTSGSISYGLFLEGSTHLSDMIDLSIRLGYSQIKNINTEIYLIDQKYNSFTFSSGISHRF